MILHHRNDGRAGHLHTGNESIGNGRDRVDLDRREAAESVEPCDVEAVAAPSRVHEHDLDRSSNRLPLEVEEAGRELSEPSWHEDDGGQRARGGRAHRVGGGAAGNEVTGG